MGDAPLLPPQILRRVIPLNFIPLILASSALAIPIIVASDVLTGFIIGAAIVYLIPPASARLILATYPIGCGDHEVHSRELRVWWLLSQLQMLFCRIPLLEEILRLVPGLYSAWLRLWGSRIGRFVYWAPGTTILDRSFLEIGDRSATGAGVRLNPHVLRRSGNGTLSLAVGRISIGRDVLIGGYSLITCGCSIPSGAVVDAYTLLPPFTQWRPTTRAAGRRLAARAQRVEATR